MILTAGFDFLVWIALEGHGAALIRDAASITDFMAKFIPAIDNMRDYILNHDRNFTTDYFRSRGLPSPITVYRAFISLNWIFFLLFLLLIATSLAIEVRKNEDKFLLWIKSGGLRRLVRGTNLFSDLMRQVYSDLRKAKIFVACLFGCLFAAFYFGFWFTHYIALYMPEFYVLIVWCSWVFFVYVWLNLVQFCLVSFYEKEVG